MLRFLHRRWRSVLGAIGGLAALYPTITGILSWIIRAMGWGGDIDFVVSLPERGWVRTMLEYLANPPSYFVVIALFVGLCLIWWDFSRNKQVENSESSPNDAKEREGVKNNNTPIMTSMAEDDACVIFHIDQNFDDIHFVIENLCPEWNGATLLIGLSTEKASDISGFFGCDNDYQCMMGNEWKPVTGSFCPISFPLNSHATKSSTADITLLNPSQSGKYKHISFSIHGVNDRGWLRSTSGRVLFQRNVSPIKSIIFLMDTGDIKRGTFKFYGVSR